MRAVLSVLGVVMGIALAPVLWGQAARAGDPLAAKGLTRSGASYLLSGEKEVSAKMRELRVAKKAMDDGARQRQQIEKQVQAAKGAIANLEFEKQRQMDALAAEKTGTGQNRIIARVNSINTDIQRAGEFKAAQEAQLRKIGEQARATYVTKVVEVAELVEKVSKEYEALAGDAEVAAALEKLNGPGRPRVKLGPSAEFEASANVVKKWRSEVNSAIIPVRMSGRVPTVEVTLDGKITRTMILDTGASTVSLPAELASELGMEPTDQHPTLRLQLADGKIVEAKQMTLKSVRVGIFTVENVDCAVLPKTLVAAEPLLGGSFLGNFIYKLDPRAGELHLARPAGEDGRVKVAEGAEVKEAPAGGKEPAPMEDKPTLNNEPVAVGPAQPKPEAPTRTSDPVTNPVTNSEPMPKPADPPITQPTPANDIPVAAGETKKVLDYLEREYKLKLQSPDWRQRALVVISLARLPQPEVTDKLMGLIDSDKDDIVRILAWQAVLARAPQLTAPQHAKWMNSTLALADKGAFRGQLRAALADVLGTAPMNARSRRIFEKVLNETNAWETYDIPVLRALGQCLGRWKNAALADSLIAAMSNHDLAYRAEYVLRAAGFEVTSSHDRLDPSVFDNTATQRSHVSSEQLWLATQADYAGWLRTNRNSGWQEVRAMRDEPWKQLKPLYVAPPVSVAELNANPDLWKSDLELGKANLKQFEVAFVVDATGSMGAVLDWLSRDVLKMMSALGTIALEPRIGITFYRDQGEAFVTKHVPLTHNGKTLQDAVQQVGAAGGGDIAEAVLEGLKEAIGNNKWSTRRDGGKAIVLIGDAPPHPQDIGPAVSLVEQARQNGFRVYAAKVTTEAGANDLASFNQIATAGGGQTIDVLFGRLSPVRFVDGATGKEISLKTIPRPEAQTIVAPAPVSDHPGERILMEIVSDAINPQYRDRLQPLVKTLLAFSEQPSPPEKRMAFPANTPALGRAEFDAQKK